MNLTATYYTMEEAIDRFGDAVYQEGAGEIGYFALTVWWGNVEWDDRVPDACVVVTDEGGAIRYVLPA